MIEQTKATKQRSSAEVTYQIERRRIFDRRSWASLCQLQTKSAHVMTLHNNGAYNLPENWHKCPDIPSLRSSAVLPESFRRFPRSTAVSHAEITNAIPPCLQFNVVRVISCIRFKHRWTHISSDKHCVGITKPMPPCLQFNVTVLFVFLFRIFVLNTAGPTYNKY